MVAEPDLELRWSARWSLTSRILAVNIFAVALLAGSFFWLDSYRVRLLEERERQTATQAVLIAQSLVSGSADERDRILVQMGDRTGHRLRIYGREGTLTADSWALSSPTYTNRDPDTEPWQRHVARWMDSGIEAVVRAEPLPDFAEPERDSLQAWPVAQRASDEGELSAEIGLAPDRTPMVSAAIPLSRSSGEILLVTGNARDIRGDVRDERLRLGIIFVTVTLVSVLLSLFLARTIVLPLRRLALSAQRVRLGRAREVILPRLPSRRDEIGLLARALSDMSQALRQRIDATEAFAADVAHELKNPIASLHSAVDSLDRVEDPELQRQLLTVVREDARRIDRLISDIAEASRVDAELTRTSFERVDMGELIETIVNARKERGLDRGVQIAFGRPQRGSAMALGDGSRLARVIENLLDNAVSFSPERGKIRITATTDGEAVYINVEDEGPGVPESARDEIFRRFHSLRPDGESFGQHSGLGLAISKTIVEAHGGQIRVGDRDDSDRGARFTIVLPTGEV